MQIGLNAKNFFGNIHKVNLHGKECKEWKKKKRLLKANSFIPSDDQIVVVLIYKFTCSSDYMWSR